MWVRAQVDYLRRLPNDMEKRRALKQLPPDLPQTYIRIFETIHRTYPPQTTKYIHRILKWLVQMVLRDLEKPYAFQHRNAEGDYKLIARYAVSSNLRRK